MSMLDHYHVMSDGQEIRAANAASEDTIDMGVADPNNMGHMRCVVEVSEKFVGVGETLIVSLQTHATTPASAVDKLISETFAVGDMVIGKKLFDIGLPREIERHIRMYYTESGAFTAGAVNAYLVLDA